jgi:mRNA interferase MazF
MKEGDIVLALLPQTDGQGKYRPAVVWRQMPGFGDLLVCGISTQLRQQIANFDEVIEPSHDDFTTSGLKAPSLIRLGFIAVLPQVTSPETSDQFRAEGINVFWPNFPGICYGKTIPNFASRSVFS